jgi:hypothetical protein
VRNNLAALAETLCSPDIWGLGRDACVVVADPVTAADMLDPVNQLAQQADDCLLLYYAGHGLIDASRGELHLALVGSDPRRIYTAVRYENIRDLLLGSRAARRIVIMDCCYSGRALGTMSEPIAAAVDEASAEGTYIMAATPENKTALAPPGARYTAFTGQLLDLVNRGVPGPDELLDLDTVYRHVRDAMRAKGLPLPQKRDRNTAGRLTLVRNRAHRPIQAAEPAQLPTQSTQARAPVGGGSARPATAHVTRQLHVVQYPARSSLVTPVPNWVNDVAFSPDGRSLATVSFYQSVNIWAVSTGGLLQSITGAGTVYRAHFSPDGRQLATVDDKVIRLWDVATGQQLTIIGLENARLAFSPDGHAVAIVNGSGRTDRLEIWDLRRRKPLRSWDPHQGQTSQGAVFLRVAAVRFSDDGAVLATAGADTRVRIWDPRTGALLHILIHPHGVGAVAFSHDNRILATTSSDLVRVWSLESGQPVHTLPHDGARLVMFGAGGWLATASSDEVRTWDPDSGRQLGAVKHDAGAKALDLSSDGRFLAAGLTGNRAVVWEITPALGASGWRPSTFADSR